MKKIIVLLVTMALSACVTTPTAPKQSAELLAPTHGYVYANFPKGANGNAMVISPINNTKKTYSLVYRDEKNAQAYGLWLPEGEYKITKWGTVAWGEYPSFSVKAGQITNLGSFVVLEVGGYEFVVLPLHHEETATHINTAQQEFNKLLKSPDIIQWTPNITPTPIKNPVPPSGLGLVVDLMNSYQLKVNKPSINKQLNETKDINAFFAIAKSTMPPQTHEYAIDKNQTLYYGADFGQVRTRSSTGEWSSIDTNTLAAVSAVEVFQNVIVTGYQNGSIRMSDDNGKTWKKMHDFATDEAVKDIDRVGSEWFVITYTSQNTYRGDAVNLTRQKVYRSTNGDLKNLTLLKEFSKNESFYTPQPHAEIAGDFYFMPFYSDLYRLNTKTQEWKLITPGKAIHDLHIDEKSNLLTSWLAAGAFSKLHISTDNGDTWKELEAPSYIIDNVYFTSPTEGKATRLAMGMFNSTLEDHVYESKKDDWKKTGEGPAGCLSLLQDETKLKQFCVMPGGNILSKKNAENKWAAEFVVN